MTPEIKQTFFETKTKPIKKKFKIPREEKITRTFSIKLKFITYVMDNKIGLDEDGNTNLNKGVNILLQNGIANLERLKSEAQKKLTVDYDKGN